MIVMAYISEDIERRLKLLGLIVLVLLAIILLRLWFLQVMVGHVYALRAEENRFRSVPIQAQRGLVLDRKGRILVGNRPNVVVTAMPSLVLGNQAVISELSDILDMSADDIEKKLTYLDQSSQERVILKEGIDEKTQVYLSERKNELPGISIEVVSVRDYPNGVAAHILGYVGKVSDEDLKRPDPQSYHPGDEIGKSGLERIYENYLRGSSGQKIMGIDSSGRPVRVIRNTESVPGSNIYLSVDLDIQKKAEEVLEKWIYLARQIPLDDGNGFYKATGGAVVILDATNAEVLAMASFPAYDPNLFVGGISQKNWESLRDPAKNHPLNNRAILPYAPASAYKVIPAIAGLEEGVLDANTFFTCRGVWKELGEEYPRYCWFKPGHGPTNLERALEVSCDIFFYQTGLELDRKRRLERAGELLQKYSFMFGLGESTGIDLPPEFGSAGRVPTIEWKKEYNKNNSENAHWFVGDTINMVIGQGDLLTTPLQIADLYLAIATRGDLYVPHLATKVETYDGQLVERFEPKIKRKIGVKREYFDLIERGLVRVTQKGTAAQAFADFPLDQIPVAGKTGTAEVIGKQNNAWFASYAPVGDPKYVVVVMVEEAGAGGEVAAQASKEIYRFLFGLEEPQEEKES